MPPLVIGGQVDRQPCHSDERVDLHGWANGRGGREFERATQPLTAFAQMSPPVPEAPQGAGEEQRGHPVVLLMCPAQRGPKVVVLPLEPCQPGGGVRSNESRLRFFSQRQVVHRMPSPHGVALGVCLQPLEPVLADRLQQGYAGCPGGVAVTDRRWRLHA